MNSRRRRVHPNFATDEGAASFGGFPHLNLASGLGAGCPRSGFSDLGSRRPCPFPAVHRDSKCGYRRRPFVLQTSYIPGLKIQTFGFAQGGLWGTHSYAPRCGPAWIRRGRTGKRRPRAEVHPPAHRDKAAMNGAQLLMPHRDSSDLMSGPPAPEPRSTRPLIAIRPR